MRSNILFITLSLAVASTVFAARPTSPQEVSMREQDFYIKADSLIEKLDCATCEAAAGALKELSKVSTDKALEAINHYCNKLTDEPAEVCSNLTNSQGPVFLDSLQSADLSGGDAKVICFQTAGICSAPDITSGTLTFPKPRPNNITAPKPSGQIIDVLHIADWHVDEQYTPGSDGVCNYPLCCRQYPDSKSKPTRPAASWGDYNCGTPMKLAENMIAVIPLVTNSSFAIMTGDIPPHDVWLENRTTVGPQESRAFEIMARLNITMYPSVGNHEAGPTNLFPTQASGGNISWLYEGLANDWSRWLSADALNSTKDYGAYTISPQPGFRIISLNTNFCYTLNLYLYAHLNDYDPNGQLHWLISQLQAAEDAGERVWILGHVAPSQTDCIQNWSALYYQVVQRYSPHVIAEQFFGHAHTDEFAVYYNSTEKNNSTAIATGWIGPSVTPYTDLNPGFRVYKVDNGSWNVFDSLTYIANLSLASEWDATNSTPVWTLEYSARQAYGAYVPIAANAPLNATWWHDVTNAFENNDTAFQEYWLYRGKSAKRISACSKGTSCPQEIICDARAGRSNDTCTPIAFIGIGYDNSSSIELDEFSQYSTFQNKPWNVKMCGILIN
ncbi:Sphingomyelin phosphodiesterase [Entomortierella lignicola]|nr:Sphingomyelin phosphodiesterase [Entomortierella lignicola]